MPAVDLFPDVVSVDSLRQALFSYPPEELEKYDRESRQLIVGTLLAKARAHETTIPAYYQNTFENPESIDRFHEMVGFLPLSLLEQVNEAWGASFESLEQYATFLAAYKAANPLVSLGTSSQEDSDIEPMDD